MPPDSTRAAPAPRGQAPPARGEEPTHPSESSRCVSSTSSLSILNLCSPLLVLLRTSRCSAQRLCGLTLISCVVMTETREPGASASSSTGAHSHRSHHSLATPMCSYEMRYLSTAPRESQRLRVGQRPQARGTRSVGSSSAGQARGVLHAEQWLSREGSVQLELEDVSRIERDEAGLDRVGRTRLV